MKFFFRSLCLVTCHLVLAVSPLYACPTCGEILERGKDAFQAMKFGDGIAWSILLMFAVPVSLVGGTLFFIVRSAKKNQATGAE